MKKLLKVTSVALSAAILASGITFVVSAQEDDKEQIRIVVENDTFSVSDGADWDGVLIDKWVDIDENTSIETILVDALTAEGYTQTGAESGYVTEIGGLAANDGGYMSGWMVMLDDWMTDEGMSSYTVKSGKLESGDEISFRYTCDWGADLGYYWDNNETNLALIGFSAGELTPEFNSDTTEYTLTLPEDVSSINVIPTAQNKAFRVKTYKNEYTPEQSGTDYKRSEQINVGNNDVIYIGVGNSAWHLYPPADSTETVYKINIAASSSEPSVTDEDKAKADEVAELINSIGIVTVDSKDIITTAREKYNALTTEQKALVTNYEVLVSAEESYSALERTQSDFNDMFSETTDTIMNTVSMNIGDEWKIMSLARADKISDTSKSIYYNNVVEYIKSVGGAKFSETKSTDNSRIIIALSSLGYNAADINGYNLVEPITDFEYVSKQGINGIVYALIALDTKNYEQDTTVREDMINAILELQLSDGGWTFWGDKSDADMTGTVIQALAPYYENNEKVELSVDKALLFLSENQNSDGTFTSYGSSDCESSAQVITALTALGIDPVDDERFIKNGNSVIDGLELFYTDGWFTHSLNGEANTLSTEQAYYALVSYSRYINNKTSLYDMTDVKDVNVSQESFEPESSMENTVEESSNRVEQSDISYNSEDTTPVNTEDNSDTVYVFAFAAILSGIIVFVNKKKLSDQK